MTTIESTYLANTHGNHDKVYNVYLKKNGFNYVVEAEWGARLGVKKSQIKFTKSSQQIAEIETLKLIQSKIAKGYHIVSDVKAKSSTIIFKKEEKPKPSIGRRLEII